VPSLITSEATNQPVVIVGAGLTGLACARRLNEANVPALVLEAQDHVGGRVRTDRVDGFLLDRGFQVFLTAYPEAERVLDYKALALRPFYPGALVQLGGRRYRFADPWRRPLASLTGLLAPVASLLDAVRIARLRAEALRLGDPDIAAGSTSTQDYLRQSGLSERVIERFFRPFFGGVFLERALTTPSSFFRFAFAMFARGSAALPAEGMQAIPQQLASGLPPGTVRLNTRVRSVEPGCVRLVSGERVECRAVVVATDADSARQLLPGLPPVAWHSTTTIYYSARRSPVREGILVLNGTGQGLVNHVCVASDVSERYAPAGAALVSVSIIGVLDLDDHDLSRRVTQELREWFGESVAGWNLLRIYRIERALPVLTQGASSSAREPIHDGVLLCGDYLEDPSINGALLSGRNAAEAVLSARA